MLLSRFLFLLPVTLLFHSCSEVKSQPEKKIQEESDSTSLTLKDLQGDWRCVDDKCEKICESCCEELVYLDFSIHNDSISIYAYPDLYFGTYKIQTDTGITGDQEKLRILLDQSFALPIPNRHSMNNYSAVEMIQLALARLIYRNDTLISHNYYCYMRDTFDSNIISQLKKDSVNLNHLAGKWEVVTKYSQGYLGDEQGDGYYHIKFPFPVPSKLTFSAKEIGMPAVQGRKLMLRSGNTRRSFYIVDISDYRLTLVPDGWYKKEPVAIDYYKILE